MRKIEITLILMYMHKNTAAALITSHEIPKANKCMPPTPENRMIKRMKKAAANHVASNLL